MKTKFELHSAFPAPGIVQNRIPERLSVMRNIFLIIMMLMLFQSSKTHAQTQNPDKKILVAYFSRSGNTQVIANQIKEATHGDIIKIEPVNSYPKSYNAVVEQAKKEIEANYKPAIKNNIENIDSYHIIFVGSPNWWGTIAPPVATFLYGYDLSGKTIIPFITHEGSRMGHSVADIKKLCPESTVLNGLSIRGSSVKTAGEEVKKWLREINMIK